MRGQRGAVLVVVLVLLAATGLAAGFALQELRLQQQQVSAADDRARARAAAEAGLTRAAAELAARLTTAACETPDCGLDDRIGLALYAGEDWRAADQHWWATHAREMDRGHFRLLAAGALYDPADGSLEKRLFHGIARGHGRRPGTVAVHAATWVVDADSTTPRLHSRQILR